MVKGYYFSDDNLTGYRKNSAIKLRQELESLGLQYRIAEIGGGEGEVIQQIVAYIDIHSFWLGVFSSLAASYIDRLLSKLYEWYRKNKTKDNDTMQIVNIDVYKGLIKKKSYYVSFRIDKKNHKKEIIKVLRISEGKYKY